MSKMAPYPTEEEFRAMTPQEFESYWKTFVAFRGGKGYPEDFPMAGRIYIYGEELPKCYALKRAGWLPILIYLSSSPFQWQWRRPVRPGTRDKVGKKFISTDQAYNSLTDFNRKKPPCPTKE